MEDTGEHDDMSDISHLFLFSYLSFGERTIISKYFLTCSRGEVVACK